MELEKTPLFFLPALKRPGQEFHSEVLGCYYFPIFQRQHSSSVNRMWFRRATELEDPSVSSSAGQKRT